MPGSNFESDCQKIHDSLGNLSQLIPFLTRRTQPERHQIRETFQEMYGEDLISHVHRYESDNSSMKCGALSMWMLDPHERDSLVAREALEQWETNFKALVEIYLSRKSSQILLLRQTYQNRYRRQLDQSIINSEPPHPYQKILMALSASHKAHHADVSQHIAKCDAKRLYETGEGSTGAIEEAVVLEILSKRSIPQLRLTISSYKHIYGHDYTKSLERKNYGEFEKALKMVVKCMCNPPSYYAKAVYTSMKGATSEGGTLSQILMSRAEVDMEEIRRVFKEKYAKEISDAICENIPSGYYRDFLVALASITSTSTSTSKSNAIGF